MICRLCLRSINANTAVFLFETNETLAETRLVKMIAKFLQLEIMPDDSISTSVCTVCCEHLEDFNSFWQLVEQKQGTLKKEFLTVDVDCGVMKWSSGVGDMDVVDVNADELPVVSVNMHEDEKPLPLDMHNLSLLGSVLDVNVDGQNEELEQEMSSVLIKKQKPDYNSDENEDEEDGEDADGEDEKPMIEASGSEFGEADMVDAEQLEDDSSDDEPLVKLVMQSNNLKPKRKYTKNKQRLSLAMELKDLLNEDCSNKSLSHRRRKVAQPARRDSPTETQESELQAALERKPKGCSRAQLTKRYEEVIASYMSANCDLCDFSGKFLSELKTHFQEVHQREFYIKCCNKIFTRASKLMDHIRKHVNPKLFTCSICNKSLNSQDYLATHIETVHNKVDQIGKVLKFPCPKCERTFSSERRLSNHLAKHDTDQLEHSCDICQKSFANVHRLRRHKQSIHEDLHPHVCDICGKKFKFKPSFERHLLEHQGVVAPAMECTICGVWLKNEHSLRLHRFTHDNTDTICPHCSKTCTSRTALRAHIKYAHKLTTNLQCTYCDKSFKQQRNLDEHMAIHTGLQLYNCPHCPKECRSRSNMYVHIKQRHADEWLKAKMARSHNPQLKPHTQS
ncbi:transcription factor grauzone [Drosophila tropicalis]|uniref:transcription factor grauzone n=1 Tax=Drosophila tropicalis TaxID=46794 RepID=UPI0035AB9DAA